MEPVLDHDMFTIPANVDNYARSRPNDIAMVDIHESLNWKEVGDRVDRLARAFVAHGLCKDDVVGLITGGEIWPYIVILAIMKAGGVVAPFSALLRPEDVETLIRDCSAKFLFLGNGKSSIGDALAGLLGDEMPIRVTQDTTGNPKVITAAEFIESADASSVTLPIIHPDDRCNIIYSSGTTGLPKGIVQSHLIRTMGSMCLGPALDISSTSRYLLAIPPHTNVTWVGFLATITSGSGFYAMGAFDLNHFFDIMRDYRPTGAFLVPVQIQAILEHPLAEQADFSCFENILSGGAPLPESTKRLVDRFLPHCFNELWGLTEGIATAIAPTEIREREAKGRFGSVGRALNGVDLRMIDSEDNEIIGPGTGELVGRSALVMKGYLNRPELNEAIKWFDGQNRMFLRTGDVAERDEDGYFYIRGRTKEMIISGGMNIYPIDMENVFAIHPDVLEVAVFGVPHPKWGETPVAAVVPREGALLDQDELREWANEQLSKHQRLSSVVVRGELLPRNVSGKILKGQLQQEWAERAAIRP